MVFYNYMRPCGICSNSTVIISKKRLFRENEFDRFCAYGWTIPRDPCEDFECMSDEELIQRVDKLR